MIKLIGIFSSVVMVLFANPICGQAMNDYNWILGYPPNIENELFGGVSIDFNQSLTSPMYFNTICPALSPAVLSSNSGRLLAYSNGCNIYNNMNLLMDEGDSIAYGDIWEGYCDYIGYPGTQNNLFLPWPGDTSKAILIYTKVSQDHATYSFLYSIIEFNNDHPLGIVLSKDINLLSTGITGFLSATKHSNGRDWWIIIPEHNSNRYFINLLQPDGVTVIDTQSIGESWGNYNHSGQSIFTTDGSKYIRFNPWKGLDIFDFDRCSGVLSNARESGPFTDPVIAAGGVACSSDSKFLYVSNTFDLYQFDLRDVDILSTKELIAQYDGFVNPFVTNFYQMALAPDGKIYIFSTNGIQNLSVINYPELRGDSCNFKQHSVKLPAFVLPGSLNMPFFRLGPEDGSFCDTLGLNNSPIADFRYEIDSLEPNHVIFRNFSYFNPKEYYWTFGDNSNTTLKTPLPHIYSQEGNYTVCLTVSNEYGNNTFCRNIVIDYTTETSAINGGEFKIYPNPFTSSIYIKNTLFPSILHLKIYSELGNEVIKEMLFNVENELDLSSLNSGIYFYQIMNESGCIRAGKLIKL